MVKQQWKRRTKGTANQKGKPFMLRPSHNALSAKLPKLATKKPAICKYPTGKIVRYTTEDMPLQKLSTSSTIITQPKPKNFEERVQHFIDMYNRGETIPPILFHKENGKTYLLDGRARLEAFRRLGVKEIPAVENGLLSSIKSGFSKGLNIAKTSAQVGHMEAKNTIASYRGQKLEGNAELSKSIGGRIGNFGRQAKDSASQVYDKVGSLGIGTGTVIKGKDGGGDIVIPKESSDEPVTQERPLVHKPCVIERKVNRRILHTYGTLLDPRTNPLAMQREGYTDID